MLVMEMTEGEAGPRSVSYLLGLWSFVHCHNKLPWEQIHRNESAGVRGKQLPFIVTPHIGRTAAIYTVFCYAAGCGVLPHVSACRHQCYCCARLLLFATGVTSATYCRAQRQGVAMCSRRSTFNTPPECKSHCCAYYEQSTDKY